MEVEVTTEKYVKRDLGFGSLGNGISVWDRLHEEDGDYMKVAHISPDRDVTFYVDLSPEDTARIEKVARESDPGISSSQQNQKIFKTRPAPQVQDNSEEDEDCGFSPR